MRERLTLFVRSAGARHGLVMAAATLVAGGFDYLVQVLVARLLADVISIFLAVTALLQVMVHATNVIRNVVAFYTAELTVHVPLVRACPGRNETGADMPAAGH